MKSSQILPNPLDGWNFSKYLSKLNKKSAASSYASGHSLPLIPILFPCIFFILLSKNLAYFLLFVSILLY